MKFKYLLFASLLVITFAKCKHEPTYKINGNGKTDTTTNNPPPPPANDSVCFNTQILPLIKASCAQVGCHDAITREEGVVLDSYTGIKKLGTSSLMAYINKNSGKVMPPLPQPRLDAASKALLNKWIAEGAKNRICTPTVCDTANVKYTTHIAPIMNIYCKGCHNTSNAGGAVNLDNYASTKTSATTGKMICTITANGCAIMPKGGPSLSKCDIRKIQIWAANGCPQ